MKSYKQNANFLRIDSNRIKINSRPLTWCVITIKQKPIALGSGSNRQIIDMLMQKLDIKHYFNAIVSADDVKEHKPHPETFLRCAELAKAEPSRCIVFEDADLGVKAGLNAGMDVFDVRTREIIRA